MQICMHLCMCIQVHTHAHTPIKLVCCRLSRDSALADNLATLVFTLDHMNSNTMYICIHPMFRHPTYTLHIHMHPLQSRHMHMCSHACTQAYTHACMLTHVYTRSHTNTACTQCTCTHTHTHGHTRMQGQRAIT